MSPFPQGFLSNATIIRQLQIIQVPFGPNLLTWFKCYRQKRNWQRISAFCAY
jgi:hypothetical protein